VCVCVRARALAFTKMKFIQVCFSILILN